MHSIPVIITVFFTGIVIDKFGTQRTAVVLSVLSLIGSICVSTGHRHFGILVLGRLLFGFGAESMSVTAQKMLAHKFKDSILSLAFGLQIFWGQLGSCLVFVVMPILNEKLGTIGALWTVPIIAIFSLGTTLAYYWIEVKGEVEMRKRSSPPVSLNNSMTDDPLAMLEEDGTGESGNGEGMAHSYRRRRRGLTLNGGAVSATQGSVYLPPELEIGLVEENEGSRVVHVVQGDKFELKDLKTFPLAFWVLLVLYFSVSTSFFVWNSFGGDRLREKYEYAAKDAGLVVALSNLAAMVSPLTGFIVDRIGHRTKFIISGTSLMLLTYCAMTWMKLLPTMWYVFLGIGLSLCQPIVFASVSLVVKDTITGTAFALMSLAMNIGQVAMPAIVGHLRAKSGSYQSSNYAFVSLALIALLFSIILFIMERSMKILDTIGLWRGTAPPSVYTELTYASHATIPANPPPLQLNSNDEEDNLEQDMTALQPSNPDSDRIPILHDIKTPRDVDNDDQMHVQLESDSLQGEEMQELDDMALSNSKSHLIQEGRL